MMTKIKSNNSSLLKYIFALPLLCAALVFFSCQEQSDLDDVLANNQMNLKIGDCDKDGILKKAEVMPRFPGCENEGSEEAKKECATNKLLTYIYTNITYPAEARDADAQGVVVASFIVDEEGNLQDLELARKVGFGTDEEVLRIIGEMPKWIPGRQNGKKVKVRYNLPVKFKLQ